MEKGFSKTVNLFFSVILSFSFSCKTYGQNPAMVFTDSQKAIDYLENNYFFTNSSKSGNYWNHLLHVSFDHSEYLSIDSRAKGKVPQQYIQKNLAGFQEQSNLDAIEKLVTFDESFEEIRIPWDEITDIKVIKNTQGDYLLDIRGAFYHKDMSKVIGSRVNWFVWADKYENIRQALLYLSKNPPKSNREIRMEKELAEKEKQEKAMLEKMNEMGSEFGGVDGAVNYLNNTVHYLFTEKYDYRVRFAWQPKDVYFAIFQWDDRISQKKNKVFEKTFEYADISLFFSKTSDGLDFIIMPEKAKDIKYVEPFFIDSRDLIDKINNQYKLKLWKRGWTYEESIRKAERAINYLKYKAENK